MARGHWLDPLAREILRLTGDLPPSKKRANNSSTLDDFNIEEELQHLKRKQQESGNKSGFFIDVNRASSSDWQKLNGCTSEMIDLLLKLQQGGVQLSGFEDLFGLLHLPPSLAEQWKPHLLFRWYSSSPITENKKVIDLNCHPPQQLHDGLNWPRPRLLRLLKERQRKPFKDLADLQDRLALQAQVIEELIGNVSFGSKSPGPTLPPKSKGV